MFRRIDIARAPLQQGITIQCSEKDNVLSLSLLFRYIKYILNYFIKGFCGSLIVSVCMTFACLFCSGFSILLALTAPGISFGGLDIKRLKIVKPNWSFSFSSHSIVKQPVSLAQLLFLWFWGKEPFKFYLLECFWKHFSPWIWSNICCSTCTDWMSTYLLNIRSFWID